MVYQMARRGDEYFLDRRFADRGNDRSMFVSRARGEDRRLVRRTADRGNDRVDSDSRDLKIKRLRQRVRDLEEIKRLRQRVRDLEEIKRLRQRVQDLELRREMRVRETESGTIVRDDVNEEEEHPLCHPHPWFYEPIYQEILSEEEPRFDEDGLKPDEEECSFVREVLSGITTLEEEPMKERYAKVSLINVGEFVMGKKLIAGSEIVSGGGDMVAFGRDELVSGFESSRESPLILPKIMGGVESQNMGYMMLSNIQIEDMNFKDFFSKINGNGGDDLPNNNAIDGGATMHIIQRGYGNINNTTNGLILDSMETRFLYASFIINKVGENLDASHGCFMKNNKQLFGGVEILRQDKSTVNKRWSNALFDPGGTCQVPSETTHEVEQFGWVVINMQKDRVDVPFDPGGFGSRTKLEDEFFSKTGSMMQEDPTQYLDPDLSFVI